MDYLSAVPELNYMTQIVIMLYEDNDKVRLSCRPRAGLASTASTLSRCLQEPGSEERFHVELHFSPGVRGCEDEEKVPLGFGFRPASSEVRVPTWPRPPPVPGGRRGSFALLLSFVSRTRTRSPIRAAWRTCPRTSPTTPSSSLSPSACCAARP